MNITINPLDYLSQDELKQIAREKMREHYSNQFTESNIAFYIKSQCIDDYLDKESQEKIKVNVRKQVETMHLFLSTNDIVQGIVKETLDEHRHLVKQKVLTWLENDENLPSLSYALQDALLKLLKENIK